ncbi:MAG TPA: CapA family protein [Anaerolineales bacterium]|nr:CapA family protein [Anaerolineales bacterium]
MRRVFAAALAFVLITTACGPAGPQAVAPTAQPTVEPTVIPVARVEPTGTPSAVPVPRPSATAVIDPSPTAEPTVTLLFTGDIQLGRCVYTLAQATGDLTSPFAALADLLSAADVTVGSLDGTISDFNPPGRCAEDHRNLLGPTSMLPGLTRAGFDVITTATNHARDCGLVRGCAYESLLETRTNLLGAGIQPVGTGVDLAGALAPVVLNVKGLRIAFLGLSGIDASLWAGPDTPGTAPLDQKAYTSAVQAAAAEADVVVALPHWGQEYKNELSWLQITHAEALAAAGADLIVGNHPHRAQAVETLPSGAVVAYALGNFVFDQQWSDGSQFTVQGIVLKVVLRGPEIVEVTPIPIHIYDNFQPRLASPESAAMIVAEMAESLRSRPAQP